MLYVVQTALATARQTVFLSTQLKHAGLLTELPLWCATLLQRYLPRWTLFIADVQKTVITELTIYDHIKTAQQRTNIPQYGDWYTDRWWVGCYIWYSEEETERIAAPSSPLIAVPNVTAHPSPASVPTTHYSM